MLELFESDRCGDRLVKTYSGGMRRRLDVGASLVARPPRAHPRRADHRPRSSLAHRPVGVHRSLVTEGTTVLLTTQYLEEADRLAHKIVVLDLGKVIAEGTSDELKDRLGGDRLEVRVSRPGSFEEAAGRSWPRWTGRSAPDRSVAETGSRCPATQGRAGTHGGGPAAGRGADIALDDMSAAPAVARRRVPLRHRSRGRGRARRPRRRPADHGRRRAKRPADDADVCAAAVGAPSPAASRSRPVVALGDIAAITRRNVMHFIRVPQLLVFSIIQPMMFVLLFRYVFGGAIKVPGGQYVNYLMPGIFVQTALFGGRQHVDRTGVRLQGRHHRPVSHAADGPLGGARRAHHHRLAAQCRGHRHHADRGHPRGLPFPRHAPGRTTSGRVLVLAFGYAFSWVYATIGLLVKDPETAQMAGFVPHVPARVRQFGVRAGGLDAWMAAGVRQVPAGLGDRERRSRSLQRAARVALRLAGDSSGWW